MAVLWRCCGLTPSLCLGPVPQERRSGLCVHSLAAWSFGLSRRRSLGSFPWAVPCAGTGATLSLRASRLSRRRVPGPALAFPGSSVSCSLRARPIHLRSAFASIGLPLGPLSLTPHRLRLRPVLHGVSSLAPSIRHCRFLRSFPRLETFLPPCAAGSPSSATGGDEPSHPDNRTTSTSILISPAFLPVSSLVSPKSSPRPISTAKLHMLPCFHRRPIYPVVSRGPYFLLGMGTFVLRGASRLDAFSVYPVRTSLPCYALGRTTVAPVVRPLRSSRTRSSSSHDSFAHDG